MKNDQSLGKRYCAVIVLFEPENDSFLGNVQAISRANLIPIVFDNSESEETRRHNRQKLKDNLGNSQFLYLSAAGNIGLSAAYNKSIEQAERLGSIEGAILLDQDSTVPPQSIRNLVAAYEQVRSHLGVGVIAGTAMRNDSIPYRVYKQRVTCDQLGNLVPVRIAPSSFSFIPFSTFRTIGKFYDDFFIDHIDVDFCFRCRNAGLLVAIDPNAPFPHKIGNGLVSLFGYAITPISSPFRHYYQVRNIMLSARRRGASTSDVVVELAKRIVIIGVVGLASGQFWKRYKFGIQGMWDGFRNRGGRIAVGHS